MKEEDLKWHTHYKRNTINISLTHGPTNTQVQGPGSSGSIYMLKEELRNRLKEKLDRQ